VFGIGLVGVVHSKIVDHQGEVDGMRIVCPQAMHDWAWMIPMWFQEHLELEVGKPSSLWEPIHSVPDFDVDMAIVLGYAGDSGP